MERNYKVSYSIDYLDPNPTIKYFDEWYEMQDWIYSEVQARIDHTVQHSPFFINEKDLKEIEEKEHSLVKIEEL